MGEWVGGALCDGVELWLGGELCVGGFTCVGSPARPGTDCRLGHCDVVHLLALEPAVDSVRITMLGQYCCLLDHVLTHSFFNYCLLLSMKISISLAWSVTIPENVTFSRFFSLSDFLQSDQLLFQARTCRVA